MRRFGRSKRAARSAQASRYARSQTARLHIEALEKRWMLAADLMGAATAVASSSVLPAAVGTAEIHGTKWSDVDGDSIRDDNEPGLAGVTIYLDANDNGELDETETSTVTAANNPGTPEDETGTYSFTGLMAGTYIVREVVPEGYEQTFPVPPDDDFDLEVVFPDNSLTPQQQAIFLEAAAKWESIIIGDVPEVFVTGIGLVDDIVITATGPSIDGPGGILGQAGPRSFRAGTFLPSSGIMQFDQADINALIASGQFDEVIVHEMGHVLGIGTIWDDLNLLLGNGTPAVRFIGPQAIAEYNGIFGGSATSVPVEGNQGGGGTLYSHWDEETFENELMTGFLNGGVSNPLSRITAGQMGDLGYDVNIDAADNYFPPGISAALVVPGAPMVEGQILAIDEPGEIVVPFARALAPLVATPGQDFWTVELADGEIAEDVDFGNRPLPASIAGTKWHDHNGNGVRDEGDEGLANWTVFLDRNGNGELEEGVEEIESDDVPAPILDLSVTESTLTVTGLPDSIVDIDVSLDITHTYDGDLEITLISPSGRRVTLVANVGGSGEDFTGTVFDDEAADDIDDGVPPFGGVFRPQQALSLFDGEDPNGTWTLEVDDQTGVDEGSLNSWSVLITTGERATVTDAEGRYRFDDLAAGEYHVVEVPQDGWFQSYPLPPGTHTVEVVPGQELTGVDFGNHQAFVGGIVWNDRNGDGEKSADEPPLPGWTVFIDENGNGLLDDGPKDFVSADGPQEIVDFLLTTSTIDVDGLGAILDVNVTLDILHNYAADVEVFLVSPDGTRVELFTDVGGNSQHFTQTTLDDEADVDIGNGATPFTGSFRPEALLSAFDGELPNGQWTLEVTDDAGADVGTLLGWTLTITTAERSTTTAADGSFGLGSLSGSEIVIGQVAPPNWETTFPASGLHEVPLVPGSSTYVANFGNRQAAIRGQKWNDLDGDGAIDEGEPGLPGWTIYLDANGNGQFDNASQTVQSSHGALPIPDLGTVTSTLLVSGLLSVSDLDLSLSIEHTYVTDLDVYLISPSGTRVEIFTDVGGTTANFNNTDFDDEATLSVGAGLGPFAGSYQPEGLLSAFDGEDPNGVWTLEVSDDAGNDVGEFKGWSLTIAFHDPFAVTDAEGDYEFLDLPPGPYAVLEVGQPNWNPTFPASASGHVVLLAVGQQAPNVNFGARSGVLTGDYDRDDDVDGNDFLLWQRGLGSAVTPAGSGADGDGDGVVDGGDLDAWQGGFGSSAVAALASALASTDDADAGHEAAFEQLDAASLLGPLAYGTSISAPAGVRPAYRPAANPAAFRAEQAAAAIFAPAAVKEIGVSSSDSDGEGAGEIEDSLASPFDAALALL
jgi:subtilisin-like proprotein convertase family protein